MFNKTTIERGATTYVPYAKTINVNKAPSADDARLLNEVQAEAEKRIVKTILHGAKDNDFEFVEVIRDSNCMERCERVHLMYKLNGRDYEIRIDKLYPEDFNTFHEYGRGIAERLAETITATTMEMLSSQLHRMR